MIGLLIFLIVLVICITVVICKFLEETEDVSIWDVKRGMKEINIRLDSIERDISRIEKGGVANERIHRQADSET